MALNWERGRGDEVCVDREGEKGRGTKVRGGGRRKGREFTGEAARVPSLGGAGVEVFFGLAGELEGVFAGVFGGHGYGSCWRGFLCL